MQIRIYPSHLEFEPYELGDDRAIEKYCSTDRTYFQKYTKPIAMMCDKTRNVLYAARGCSVNWLEARYGEKAIEMPVSPGSPMSKKYKTTSPPKNEFQKEAIQFLNGDGEYSQVYKIRQVGLNVEPGFGKTYCAVAAAINRGKKTLILVPNNLIKNQWVQTIHDRTNIPDERVLVLSSSKMIKDHIVNAKKIREDIFIMTDGLFSSYLKANGFDDTKRMIEKMSVGTKIIDEAHLRLEAVMKIEFICNVERNYYLTATFSRSNPAEVKLFKRIFANVPMYRKDKKDIEKNVVYIQARFRGWADSYAVNRISELKTNQAFGYLMYETRTGWFSNLDFGAMTNMESVLMSVVCDAFGRAEGKMLITVGLVEIVDKIAKYMEKSYSDKKVGKVYHLNDKEENERIKQECDIIISTIGSFGTGADVPGLRHVINLEPFSSKVTTNQIMGRLRPFDDGSESYFYDMVDVDFPYIQKTINKKLDDVHRIARRIETISYE